MFCMVVLTASNQRKTVVDRSSIVIIVVVWLLVIGVTTFARELVQVLELLELFKILGVVVVADKLAIAGNSLTVRNNNLLVRIVSKLLLKW